MNLLRRFIPAAFLGLIASATPVCAADVTTLTGKAFKGSLTAVDPQILTWKEEGGGTLKLNVKELAAVELGPKPLDLKPFAYDEIELTDGSLLRLQRPATPDDAQKLLVKGKKVLGESLIPAGNPSGPKFDIPLGTLSYLMRSSHDATAQTAWKALLAKREKRDALLINNGGTQQRLLGTVLEGNDTGDRITFEDEKGMKLNFALARVNIGLIFNQPPRDVIPPTICRVIDIHGNILVATAIELGEKTVKVTTVSGAVVEYPALTNLARLDFSQSNVTYLSALTPVVSAPEDLLELFATYSVDKTRQGKSLTLAGKSYAKGLSVFGGVSLSYKLDGEYREFKAVVGVDDSIEVANSKVKLSIVGDGRTLFSKEVSRKDKPQDLTIDVKDIKELKIVVERQELYYANTVNLCEVRVQK